MDRPLMEIMAYRTLRASACALVACGVDLTVDGAQHVPEQGPAIIASRHVHHLYDGCVMFAALNRPPHLLVALDWVEHRWGRAVMEWACRTARWPVVLRADGLEQRPDTASAYQRREAVAYTRHALALAMRLLAEGSLLVVFPEAYPVIDPVRQQDRGLDALLPFRPGLATIAARARPANGGPVPVVPAGLTYRPGRRWQVALRFGAPVLFASDGDRSGLIKTVEEQVRLLSAPSDLQAHPVLTP